MKSKLVRADGTVLDGVKSVVYKEQVNSDTDLRPGCVASASIEVEVYGTQDGAVDSGEALTYYQVDSEGNETLFGTFYAEPTIQTRNTYKFTAYDAVSKLDADFSDRLTALQDSFPVTLAALVSEACAVADVTLTGTFPLSDMTVQAFYADGIKCRQIFSWAAEIACRFVRCDTEGNIKFDWYEAITDYRITPGSKSTEENVTWIPYKQDGLHYENYETSALSRVAIHPTDEDQVAYIYPTSATSGNTLDVYNNLLLTGAEEDVYMAIAKNLYDTISSFGTYRPAQISLFPFMNPFRAGQMVPVTDIQGVSFVTPIMSMRVQESVAQLDSTGGESYSAGSSTIQETVANLADNIVRLKRLKVDWADIQQAIVQYLELYGFMTVYEDKTLSTEGGKIGYASGSNNFGGGVAIQHIGDGDPGYAYNATAIVAGDKALFLGSGKGIQLDGGVDVSQNNFSQYILMDAADVDSTNGGTIEIGVGGNDASLDGTQPSVVLSIGLQSPRALRPVNTFNGYSDFEELSVSGGASVTGDLTVGGDAVARYLRGASSPTIRLKNADGTWWDVMFDTSRGTYTLHYWDGNTYTNYYPWDMIGVLSNLTTSEKASLVAAVNEVAAGVASLRSNAFQSKNTLPSGTDVSAFYTPGCYQLSGANTYTNLPTGVTWGTLLVFRPLESLASFTVQMLIGSGASMHIRIYTNSNWSAWRTI